MKRKPIVAGREKERLLRHFEEKIAGLLERLASFTSGSGEGVTRLLYSPEWLAAQRDVAERMRDEGLAPEFDEVGNVFGRLPGTGGPAGAIVTGSHIDTVAQGGRFDGAYGIAAGLAAVGYLHRTYGLPRRTLEVVSLCEEEGSRFPLAYWGSGSIAGLRSFAQVRAEELRDADGIPFVEAMRSCGFGEGSARPARRGDMAAFIELHIEQGAVLERAGAAVGIVEAIAGQRRIRVEVRGETNHAGTTPMTLRRDALEGACAMISLLRQEALQWGAPLVATVGHIEARPNMPNAVSGEAAFTVDIRHADREALEAFGRRLREAFRQVAAERGLALDCAEWLREEPTPMSAELAAGLADSCAALGLSPLRMISGAGHDAQMLARICPAAMLFVPSRGGISHSPLEYTRPRELAAGALVLAELLYRLGYEEERAG